MIANIGFSIASLGYLLLLLLLFTIRKKTTATYLLIFAVVTTIVWSLQYNLWLFPSPSLEQYLFFETIKQISWLVFLCAAIHNQFGKFLAVLRQRSTLIALFFPLLALLGIFIPSIPVDWLFLLQTILALVMLLYIEVLIRQAGDQRWAFKPLVLYLGVISIFDFVIYANATMVTYLDINFIAAKGYIYAGLLPLLVLATRRMQHWGIKIFISREIVLHSTLLTVAGLYLFIMASAGYVIRYFGGDWSMTVQVILLVLSLVLLGTLMMSTQFRTKMKVFITKNFFANQFDYREQWIELTNHLAVSENTLRDVYHTALTGLIKAVKYDAGLLVKAQGNGFTIVAQHQTPEPSSMEKDVIEQSILFCRDKPWLIDLRELLTRPENYQGLELNPQVGKLTSYQFILPIYKENQLWGLAILQADNAEKRELNWELRDYLNAVLAQVSNFLLHYEAASVVAENAQFAAFSRMSAFVVHDLKNVLAQIDMILANAQQHRDNPEFIDDTFETLGHTQTRMHKMLSQLTEKQISAQDAQQSVQLSTILTKLIEQKCATLTPVPELIVLSEAEVCCSADKIETVFYHLISNAQQATSTEGSVQVILEMKENSMHVILQDTGHGMTQTFIDERLFKPFDTTKGNAGMGIGAYDAKQYIAELGGSIKVESIVDKGSTFTIILPI